MAGAPDRRRINCLPVASARASNDCGSIGSATATSRPSEASRSGTMLCCRRKAGDTSLANSGSCGYSLGSSGRTSIIAKSGGEAFHPPSPAVSGAVLSLLRVASFGRTTSNPRQFLHAFSPHRLTGALHQLSDSSNISPSPLGTPGNRCRILSNDIDERAVLATAASHVSGNTHPERRWVPALKEPARLCAELHI